MDLHEFGIRLGVLHGFACTIPLNFQNANRRLRRLAFQVEGLAKLLQCGLRFVKILLGLFGIDARDDLDLLHFELSFAQTVFRLLDFRFIFGASCTLFMLAPPVPGRPACRIPLACR